MSTPTGPPKAKFRFRNEPVWTNKQQLLIFVSLAELPCVPSLPVPGALGPRHYSLSDKSTFTERCRPVWLQLSCSEYLEDEATLEGGAADAGGMCL